MEISGFGDFTTKSSELQRMVRNNALFRDKPTLIQAEDF